MRKVDAWIEFIAAHAALTRFVAVAESAVRTGQAVHDRIVDATGQRIASIRRADVSVIAVRRRSAQANAERACVGRRAGIAIVTGQPFISGLWFAYVNGLVAYSEVTLIILGTTVGQ